ncbi:MAG: transcription antitermination factor NusB [Kiritimatiellae bacterium]|nr:transcription antitermination factor NusB [Kiritimatiellia bacterium]
MVTRRQAREWAVMMLCECDLNPPSSIDGALAEFWEMQIDVERNSVENGEYGVREAFTVKGKKHAASLVSMKEFAEQRIKGVLAHKDELDAALDPFLDNWEMYRLGTVDRNVLRLGAWELTYDSELPAPIAINEAVDLAKFFSDSQSGRFVNGVLDKYSKFLQSKKSGEGQ